MSHAEAVAVAGGLVVGSFLNVCIQRLPADESVIRPGSRCPRCRAPIRPWDNIPVLSYLLLRGRCRACRGAISWRYPAVEILTGLLFLGVVWRFGVGGRAVAWAAFLAGLVVVAFIDLEHMIVPDEVSLPGIAAGLLAAWAWPPPGIWSAALGVLLGGGLLWAAALAAPRLLTKGRVEVDAELRIAKINQTARRLLNVAAEDVQGHACVEVLGEQSDLVRVCREAAVEGRTYSDEPLDLPGRDGAGVPVLVTSTVRRGPDHAFAGARLVLKREGMGLGDVKLAAMIGAFLGWQGLLVAFLLGTLSGSLVGLGLLSAGLKVREEPIPFGPFLALGATGALFWGEGLVRWYWRLLA
jgi:leader peptidase (prepilin peptidase)/N-methyltransferase